MEQNQAIDKMLKLLINNGHSQEEAVRLINESTYCKQNDIELTGDELTNQTSVEHFLNTNQGFLSLRENLKELETQPEWHRASNDIQEQKQFLIAGWNVFQNIRWMSWIYMVVITTVVLILDNFVAPAYQATFNEFGVELPKLTELYFSSGNLAIIAVLFVWLLGLGYLVTIKRVRSHIKAFRYIPNWVFKLPLFRSISLVINRCILLNKFHFLTKFKTIELSAILNNSASLGLVETSVDFPQQQELLNELKLAEELNVSVQFLETSLEQNMDQFVTACTRSMRLISLIGTIILGVIIANVVIAMYLPIFMFGAIF